MDLGKRRIGLALSDPLGITAQGIETFQRTTIREDMSRIRDLLEEHQVTMIVLGNPINMNGTEGRQSGHAREFAERLQSVAGVPIEMWDERWTSVEANRVLRESGMSLDKRKRQVDKLSAVLILESYLDARRYKADEAGE